jgi:hypothetical protein
VHRRSGGGSGKWIGWYGTVGFFSLSFVKELSLRGVVMRWVGLLRGERGREKRRCDQGRLCVAPRLLAIGHRCVFQSVIPCIMFGRRRRFGISRQEVYARSDGARHRRVCESLLEEADELKCEGWLWGHEVDSRAD